MTAKPRWVFWARGMLLSAICGHWMANAVLDADQFKDAGLEYTWRASMPIVMQTVLVLVVVHSSGRCRRLAGRWVITALGRSAIGTSSRC